MEVGLPGPLPTGPSSSGLLNCGSSSQKQQQQVQLGSLVSEQPRPPELWIGAGLENLGNTCFLNAVVQCLVHTVPLVQTLRSLNHKSRCSGNEDFCSLCAFQSLMERCLRLSDGAVEPALLVDNLDNISSSFRRFQQEDAHEFLLCLLDSLENCCNKRDPKNSPNSKDDNFVQNIFGGRLQSQVKCCNCGHISGIFEPTVDLSLEIDDSDTLTGALESFTNVEKIDDPENKFTCEGCKEHVFVEKQLKVDRLPTVILLHLKRFKSAGHFSNKIDKHVDYPMELDLAPYVATSPDQQSLKYDLYAVLVHDGWSSYSGHYYCVIRSSNRTWHVMDDSEVHEISEEQASSRQAYILFYVRQGSSPWFSSLLKEELGSAFNMAYKQTSPSSVLDTSVPVWASSPERENRDALPDETTTKADSGMESLLGDRSVDSWLEEIDRDLRLSSSPSSDAGEPGVSGSIPACVKGASNPQTPMAQSRISTEERVATPPRLVAREHDLKKVFYDEQFDDDGDQENYLLIRPASAQTTPVSQPPSQFKDSGGARNRMNEIINRQMLQMPSGRRQALMAHISPSHLSSSSEIRHKKRPRTRTV